MNMNLQPKNLYGDSQEVEMSKPIKRKNTYSYSPKDTMEDEIPKNAKIISVEKNIDVREIENGFLKTTNTYTRYKCVEESESEMGNSMETTESDDIEYCSQSKTVYYKDKPIEVNLKYEV